MPLRCGREATDLVRKASAAYTKAMTGDDTNPFLETTSVEKFSQLRRVEVGLKVTTGRSHCRATYTDALVDLKALLSLHLPFVTIRGTVKVHKAVSRAMSCYWALAGSHIAFKRFQNDPEIHAEYVIFEHSIEDNPNPSGNPYLLSVRQTTRSRRVNGQHIPLKRARYVLHVHAESDEALKLWVREQPDSPSSERIGRKLKALDRIINEINVKNGERISNERKIKDFERIIEMWRRASN
jgi:hypothetical protein